MTIRRCELPTQSTKDYEVILGEDATNDNDIEAEIRAKGLTALRFKLDVPIAAG